MERLLSVTIASADVLSEHSPFLTGSRGSAAVLSEWSGFAILVVWQMQREVFFRPVSAPRNRGRLDTLNVEIIMDRRDQFLILFVI